MTIIDGNSKAYTDSSFVSGDSPKVLSVNADLGRDGPIGYLANDGTGTLQFAIFGDGTNYGDTHTLYSGEVVEFENQSINKIKLTHVVDTAYRIYVA